MLKRLLNRAALLSRAPMLAVTLVVACALALPGLALPGASAAAQDKVHLKDGRVFEGKIEQEIDGNIWLVWKIGAIEQREFLRAADIDKVERDAAPAAEAKPATGAKPDTKARTSSGDRSKRAAIITLGEGGSKDMVGVYMTAEALKRAIPLLEEENVGIVVFHVNSGGGYLLEIQKLSDVIQNEYKPRFRVAAWIESAISAAAMTSHCIEDIYFRPEGNYGACTGWSGALVAVEGRQLEEVLYMMEKISTRGQKDPQIMRSMQIMEPLSCTIDSNGDVKWFNSLDGENLVNPEGRILTFNAVDAERFKFSKGTAANLDELAKAMGLTEVEWVGETRPGYIWPISKAEQLQMDFRAQVHEDEVNTNQYFDSYQNAIAAAQSEQDRTRRGAMVARARESLRRIIRMVKNNPNFAITILGTDPKDFDKWVDEQEEFLRNLMK